MASIHRSLGRLVALLLVTTALALGFGAPAAAEDPRPQTVESPEGLSETGTSEDDAVVTGLVYDPDGNLVDNIQVEAVPATDPTASPVASALTYEWGNSESHGAYALTLPAGDYLVRFSTPYWEDTRVFETLYYGGGAGTTVTVAPGETLALDDVTLVRDSGVTVTGVVRDGSGQPLRGLEVSLMRFVQVDGEAWHFDVDWETTDSSGAYTFEGVNRNRPYSVLVNAGWSHDYGEHLGLPDTWLGDAAGAAYADRFTLGAGDTGRALADITVRTGAQVTGLVVQPDSGEDWLGATLRLQNPDGSFDYVDSVNVEEDGSFSFPAVHRGVPYTIGIDGRAFSWTTYLGDGRELATAQTFDVLPTETLKHAGTITLGADSTLVSGLVQDADGDPAPYVDLKVWRLVDGVFEHERWASADEDGRYRLRLLDGTYTVEAAYDLWDGGQSTFLGNVATIEEATTFTTPGAGAADLTPIALPQPRNKLVGHVRDADSNPVANAQVLLWTDWCDGGGCWADDDYARTDENGRYVFRHLEAGAGYRVSAEKRSLGYPETFAGPDAVSLETARTYTVPEAGGTAGADDIVLSVASGTVRGVLSTSDGEALRGTTYLDLHQLVDDGSGGHYLQLVDETWTDDATFAFTNVPPGDGYTVSAFHSDDDWESPQRYVRSWFGGARPAGPASSGLFTVDALVNPTTGINVELDRGVELTGTVTGGNGDPLRGASVSAYEWVTENGDDNTWYAGDATTGSDGRYSIRVPRNSELHVSAYRTGYADYTLGGSSWPKTTANTLPGAADGTVTHDFSMAPQWEQVGTVAGQQQEYCLDRVSHGYAEIDFAGLDLTVDGRGVIRQDRDVANIFGPLDPETRQPALVPLSGDGLWTGDLTWGISGDGQTLCLVNRGWGEVFQVLLTRPASGTGLDVTYNYDELTSADGSYRAGHTDGEGGTGHVVFPGHEDGGYADGQPGALTANSVGSGTPGRYQFHFDGFEPRLAAPRPDGGLAITGTPAAGEVLTAEPGTWLVDGVPATDVELRYAWETSSGTVTGPTYTVQPGDAGRRIWLTVQAWVPGHDFATAGAQVRIAAGPPVATNTVLPSLSPTSPAVGDVVTADRGSWTPADGLTIDDVTFVHKWFRNGNRIWGESGSTYEVRPGDALAHIHVRVVARRTGFARQVVDSAPVTVADLPGVTQTGAPTLTGQTKVGETMTVTPGSWDAGGEPVTLSYRWSVGHQTRNADTGSGGTAYTVQPGDLNKQVSVYVTASAPGHHRTTWHQSRGPVVPADAEISMLTVHVQADDGDGPVEGAWVTVCDASWNCLTGGSTDASGDLTGQATNGSAYRIYVYPPGSSSLRSAETSFTMPAEGDGLATVELVAPEPPPPNVAVPTSSGTFEGVPVVYWQEEQVIEVAGCDDVVDPGYTVTFSDGTAPWAGSLTRDGEPDAAGIVTFTATIPAFYPSHGDTTIATNVPPTCEEGSEPTVFHVYIDPSGVVTDQYGRAIENATVTLQRSDSVGGPYVTVPDGSEIMSEDNRTNPDLTDSTGFFRWDVVEGWYRVRAEKTGCTPATTEPMQVLPARVDLLVKLECTAAPSAITPTILGNARVGETLVTNTAAWDDLYDVSVQWLRAGVPIGGATSTSYEVQPADRGQAITVRHVADRPSYVQEEGRGTPVDFTAVTRTSDPVTPVAGAAPTVVADAAIAGTGKVGTSLEATAPIWVTTGFAVTRQWYNGTEPIAGATQETYQVTPGDVGDDLTVRYTATRDGYETGTSTSNAVTGQLGDAPTADVPAVTGTPKTGQSLTVAEPNWSRTGTLSTHQWFRGTAPIDGATEDTYQLTPDDVGEQITVTVTGTRDGYQDGQVTTDAVTGQLGDAAQASAGPQVSGTARVGQILSATTGTWDVPDGLDFTYQWLRDDVPIAGAEEATYQLVAADATRSISVRVTATRPGYADGTATSAAVAVPKMASTTSARLARSKIPASRTGSLTVTVKVPGLARPTGKIKILDGSRLLETVTLGTAGKGVVTVKLPKLKKGKHKLSASYQGNATVAGSTSKVVTLTVT